MQTHKVLWRVSLNNGETITEGRGGFEDTEKETSPWQKLSLYLAKNRLTITSLALVTEDGRTFNLPSVGKNPRFKYFNDVEKPKDYRCSRAYGCDRNHKGQMIGEPDWFTIGIAVYNNYELQIWVDENNPKNCWTLVKPI